MFDLRIVFAVAALLPAVIKAANNENSGLRGDSKAAPFLSSIERELQCSLSEAPVGNTPECASVSTQDFDLCFGVRGNGPRLFAHYPAVARAVEEFGIPSAYIGSSSATFAGFLFESILENPLITDCGGGQCCSDMEQRARVSFFLKTFQDIATDSFISGIFILPQTLLKRAQDQNIPFRLASPIGTNKEAAKQDLLKILTEPFGALRSTLVNPELIELLNSTSPTPIRHALDVLRATGRGFDTAGDPLSFMREYFLNLKGVAWSVDFVGSFMAGLEPTKLDEMQTLLTECASVANIGKEYSEIKQQQTSTGETCSMFYMRLYGAYLNDRGAYLKLIGEDTGFPSRLDVTSGQAKLTTLISTAVVTGNAFSTISQGIEDYKNGTLDIDPFDIDFENEVFFGYYGPKQVLSTISSRLPTLFNDAKSQKFFSLGAATWLQKLASSPAEPTLGNAVAAGVQSVLSLGGWPDPAPSQVLQAMGCERVVLINRPGGLGNFSTGIASLLGASDAQVDALYSLEDPESGFDVAFQAANATFCVDWDAPSIDPAALAKAAYDAPLVSDEACILSLDMGATFQKITGCTSVNAEAPPGFNDSTGATGEQTVPTSGGTSSVVRSLVLASGVIASIFNL